MRDNRFFKIYLVLSLSMIFLLCICGVYAEDVDVNDNVTFACDSADESCELSEFENEDLLGKTYSLSGGKFSDIQDLVDKAKSGDTIKLSGSFKSQGKQITIDKKLTITSSNGATIDGASKSRIFNIKSSAKGLVISNINFKNGYGKDQRGGAIYLNATNVVIDKCAFNNCFAVAGGAIATPANTTHADNLIVKNSEFTSNHGTKAGGAIIYIAKNLQIISCNFDSNYIIFEEDEWCGGALQIGIKDENNNCRITDSTFSNNYAMPSGDYYGHAGAACLRGGVTFENCIFTNNHAQESGALSFHDGGSVINCKFYNNYVTNYGGAIRFDDTTKKVLVSNSEFKNNTGKYGGALAITYSTNVEITQSQFTNNKATDYGGALWINHSPVLINNSSFSQNAAINGSAIYNNDELELYNTNFNDNCAKSYKLISNNCEVTQGENAEIKVYLEYGDNYPGIYTTPTLKINNKKASLNSGAQNQIITLSISDATYKSKTNSQGIATFKIKTGDIKPDSYKFTLKHEKSSISTSITSSYTLKVNKKISTVSKSIKKMPKKVKKHKKSKKKKKKTITSHKKKKKKIIINNKGKYNKITGKSNKKKSLFKFKKFISKLPKNKHSKQKENKLLKELSKGYGGVKNWLDTPLFTIKNYQKTLKSWGIAGDIVGVLADFFLGINSKGEITIGSMILNLLSLACGAGFYIKGAKIISKGLKYLPKLGKIIKNNKFIQKSIKFFTKLSNKIVNHPYIKKLGKNFNNLKKNNFKQQIC